MPDTTADTHLRYAFLVYSFVTELRQFRSECLCADLLNGQGACSDQGREVTGYRDDVADDE